MASNTKLDLEDDLTEVVEQNVVAVDSKVSSMAGENPNKLVFLNKNC